MKTDKQPPEIVTKTITRTSRKTHIQDFIEKLDETPKVDGEPHTLHMGWNYYHEIRPVVERVRGRVQMLFVNFHGFRFMLDERIPPNLCEMRDQSGTLICKFFWSA